MTRRWISAAIAAVLAVGLAACGDDSAEQRAPDVDDTLPSVTDGYQYPRGSGAAVIEYRQVGGFVPAEIAFQQTPTLIVTGDGRALSPAAVIEIYPGPMVPPMQVRTITDEGIQALLAAADDVGLFADIDYDVPTQIADAPTTRLTINVDGHEWVHEAYALGISPDGSGTESSAQRRALADFVSRLTDLPALAGAGTLGDEELYEPSEYGIRATPAGQPDRSGEIEPTVEQWPTDASVRLADAGDCAVVPAAEFGALLETATTLTWFDDDGVTYEVYAKPILPGTVCG